MSTNRRPRGGQQLAHAAQRAGDVEEVIDRLAEDDEVEPPVAEIDVLDQPFDRLEAERLRLGRLERRRVDDRRAQVEALGKGCATTPVDPPMSSIVRIARPASKARADRRARRRTPAAPAGSCARR